MSQISLSPLPPMCAAMGDQEFPRRLLATAAADSARALNVGLLNLMPTKEVTERQWLRLLLSADHPYPLKLHLLKLASWRPTHVNPMHMARYYTSIETALATNQLDMLIITGAPLGRLEYAEVGYWAELTALMCELEVRGLPTLFSCWAAQAALHHLYQVPTLRSETKLSGVFAQRIVKQQAVTGVNRRLSSALNDFVNALMVGGSATISPLLMPQSRFARPDPAILQQRVTTDQPHPFNTGLSAVLTGDETGISVLSDERKKRLFLLGHPEYEADTLALEYARDLAQDINTQPPLNHSLAGKSSQWQTLGGVLLRHWLAGGQSLLR